MRQLIKAWTMKQNMRNIEISMIQINLRSSESFKEQPSETIQSSQTLESEHATSTSEPHSTSSSQESQSQGSEMDTEVSHSKSEAPAKTETTIWW